MDERIIYQEELRGMDLAGREIVLCEAEGSTRGIIDEVKFGGDGVRFGLKNSEAQVYDPQTGEWSEETISFVGPFAGGCSTIRQQDDGTITVSIPYIGRCYISPVGCSVGLPSAKMFA